MPNKKSDDVIVLSGFFESLNLLKFEDLPYSALYVVLHSYHKETKRHKNNLLARIGCICTYARDHRWKLFTTRLCVHCVFVVHYTNTLGLLGVYERKNTNNKPPQCCLYVLKPNVGKQLGNFGWAPSRNTWGLISVKHTVELEHISTWQTHFWVYS